MGWNSTHTNKLIKIPYCVVIVHLTRGFWGMPLTNFHFTCFCTNTHCTVPDLQKTYILYAKNSTHIRKSNCWGHFSGVKILSKMKMKILPAIMSVGVADEPKTKRIWNDKAQGYVLRDIDTCLFIFWTGRVVNKAAERIFFYT